MKILLFLSTLLFFATAECAPVVNKADEITFDFLVRTGEQTGYCDHVPIFKTIFDTIKVKTLLEFGLGYSTKYFLDNCTKVISVEFVSQAWGADWIKKCLELYKEYSNWVPVAYFTNYKGDFSWAPYKYFGSEAFFKADTYFCNTRQSYATVDSSYATELQTFVTNLSKYNKIDIALVDQGNCLRGEIVQLMFGKVPIVISCDMLTSKISGYDPYGFKNIKVPEEYEEIYISKGKGTTVWVKKTENYAQLIQVLNDYAK